MIILLFHLQPQFKNELFSYTSHYGPTQPLSDFDVLSVQRQALQTVTRYSYGLFSFCCCSRNCHAKHRGTSPSYLNANCTSGYVTLTTHSPPYTKTKSTIFTNTLTDRTWTNSSPRRSKKMVRYLFQTAWSLATTTN